MVVPTFQTITSQHSDTILQTFRMIKPKHTHNPTQPCQLEWSMFVVLGVLSPAYVVCIYIFMYMFFTHTTSMLSHTILEQFKQWLATVTVFCTLLSRRASYAYSTVLTSPSTPSCQRRRSSRMIVLLLSLLLRLLVVTKLKMNWRSSAQR